EYLKILVKTESPGIVVELAHRFEIGTVPGKPVDPHLEFYRLALEPVLEARIPHGAPDHVVHAIAQVGRPRMRVPGPETIEEHAPFVHFVVPLGILQEAHIGSLRHYGTARYQDDPRGQVL